MRLDECPGTETLCVELHLRQLLPDLVVAKGDSIRFEQQAHIAAGLRLSWTPCSHSPSGKAAKQCDGLLEELYVR